MSGYLLTDYILAISIHHSATCARQPPAKTSILSPCPARDSSPSLPTPHCESEPQGQQGHDTASFASPKHHQLSFFSCRQAMPSVLSPNNPVSRSYAPLIDETNPPITTSTSKTVPYNGPAMYGQPDLPPAVAASSSTGFDDLQKAGMSMRSDSEEALSPSTSRKGKERAKAPMFDGDLDEVRRGSFKGKERVWDIEQGIYSEEQLASENSCYPPTNEAEEEERRIQEVSECSYARVQGVTLILM